MSLTVQKRISLEDLASETSGMSSVAAAFYRENCVMCLDVQQHVSGVGLSVEFDGARHDVAVYWTGAVTDDMHRWYADLAKRVDFGACALALLLIAEFTEFVAIEQSATGNGFDYYLVRQGADDDLVFNDAAHLEVSGIEAEHGSNTVDARIREKRRRLAKFADSDTTTTGDRSTYICVVEFGTPKAKVVIA